MATQEIRCKCRVMMILFLLVLIFSFTAFEISAGNDDNDGTTTSSDYTIVDTGQDKCYDNNREITPLQPDQSFYGQDAQYVGVQPAYQDNGDGTITDLATGLMWQQADAIRIYNYVRCVRDAEVDTGVEDLNLDSKAVPSQFTLEQNYPNPFNPSTTIAFSLLEAKNVNLKIYDICGKQAAILVDGRLSEGTHTVQWQAENLPSGIYYYLLKSGSFSETKRMILFK